MKAYSRSKLAQVMSTFELAEHPRCSGVTVNALHPASLIDTKMVQSTFGYSMSAVEEGKGHSSIRLANVSSTHRVCDELWARIIAVAAEPTFSC
jgi:NAD(P)-dependent dehydrogenase (short-subunit alcohol dehydrogenase family)